MTRTGGSDTRTSVAAFDLSDLEAIEAIDVRVSFEWHLAGALTIDANGFLRFPAMPRLPGLYRFDFSMIDAQTRALYIGESENLRKRVGNYRNAKKDGGNNRTSRRIHKEVVAHLSVGGTIDFAITTDVRIGGDVVTDLRRKSARRLAENAAVLRAQTAPNVQVLNIDADLGSSDESPSE